MTSRCRQPPKSSLGAGTRLVAIKATPCLLRALDRLAGGIRILMRSGDGRTNSAHERDQEHLQRAHVIRSVAAALEAVRLSRRVAEEVVVEAAAEPEPAGQEHLSIVSVPR